MCAGESFGGARLGGRKWGRVGGVVKAYESGAPGLLRKWSPALLSERCLGCRWGGVFSRR